jgi:hypothetical protein
MGNIHGKDTVVHVDGYDVTGDSSALEPSFSTDMAPVMGFGDAKNHYIAGLTTGVCRHAGFFTDNADKMRAVLQDREGAAVDFMAAYGTAIGAYGYAGSAELVNEYGVKSAITGAVTIGAAYQFGKTGGDPIRMARQKAEGSGTSSASVLNETPTNDGVRAYLQIFAIAGGTPIVALQHGTAATDAAYSDLVAFTATESAHTADGSATSGTVRQYIRTKVTEGTCTYAMAYRRL